MRMLLIHGVKTGRGTVNTVLIHLRYIFNVIYAKFGRRKVSCNGTNVPVAQDYDWNLPTSPHTTAPDLLAGVAVVMRAEFLSGQRALPASPKRQKPHHIWRVLWSVLAPTFR